MPLLSSGGPGICLYLYCGDGVSAGQVSSAGYRVIGLDLRPWVDWPGDLIVQDVRTFDGRGLCHQVDLLLASPPCTEFSRHSQPWFKNLPPPDMSHVDACFRIAQEIKPRLFVMENVRGLQKFIGPATVVRHPYYFWGDLVLLPPLKLQQKQTMTNSRMSPAHRSQVKGRWPAAISLALASQLSPLSPGER